MSICDVFAYHNLYFSFTAVTFLLSHEAIVACAFSSKIYAILFYPALTLHSHWVFMRNICSNARNERLVMLMSLRQAQLDIPLSCWSCLRMRFAMRRRWQVTSQHKDHPFFEVYNNVVLPTFTCNSTKLSRWGGGKCAARAFFCLFLHQSTVWRRDYSGDLPEVIYTLPTYKQWSARLKFSYGRPLIWHINWRHTSPTEKLLFVGSIL